MLGDFFTALVSQTMLVFDMKITVFGFIIQMSEWLDLDYCYEEFYPDNYLLVTCKNHLMDAFVFDPFLCLHYYILFFYNALGCKFHPRGYKIVKCYICYRRCVKEINAEFSLFIK